MNIVIIFNFFPQTNIVRWNVTNNSVNFPGAKIKYEARIKLFSKSGVSNQNSKIKLDSEKPLLNLTEILANLPSYTKFRFELISKTNWAISHETAVKEFFTKGSSASEPRNFRVFWFPVEKVLIFSIHWI